MASKNVKRKWQKPSIPKIQMWGRAMADELFAQGFRNKAKKLRRWMTLLSRVKSVRKAPASMPMPTPAKVLAVRAYRVRQPNASYRWLANRFKVGNDGRVSEIIRGKRGRPVYDKRGYRIKYR